MTVAILDSGFRGYRRHAGAALPREISVRSFRSDGDLEASDSQHGILCGEIVHALAPQARLVLANWEPDQPRSFLDAIRWARAQGAAIISCSLIMPSWSDGEGGGAVHADLARLLGDGRGRGDLLFFASAGNTARRHWSGPFHADDRGFHEWLPHRPTNALRPWGRERVAVEIYGPLACDCDLEVRDEDSTETVGHASIKPGTAVQPITNESGSRGVVRFLPQPNRSYSIRLRRSGAAISGEAGNFHLVVLGGSLGYGTTAGSIPFPADGSLVQAVGAVNSEGRRLFYSSCGPNSRYPKPDLVATVPFASFVRDRAFSGTSAAAPQAAGIAALLWSRHSDWNAEQVRQALRSAAKDLGPVGHDWETGYGLIRLPTE